MPFTQESPYDILIVELETDSETIAIYACLRKEHSIVTIEGKKGFAINSQVIRPSLGYIDGNPRHSLHTITMYDGGDHYKPRVSEHGINALADRVRALGITLSPALLDSVALGTIGFSENQIAVMRQNGRMRRLPLNPPETSA